MVRRMKTLVLMAALPAACYTGVPDPEGAGVDDPTADGGEDDSTDEPVPASCDPAGPFVDPAPLVRLSRFEYDNTIEDLLGDDSRPAAGFTADEKLGVFDANVVAPVSVLAVEQYLDAAEAIAARAVQDVEDLVGCEPAQGEACAREFAARFARRAFRRPVTDVELDRLMEVYAGLEAAGWSGEPPTFADRIEAVLAAILQSPHLLYRVELGTGEEVAPGVVALRPHEVATRLSYMLWASAPDDGLLDAADEAALGTPEQLEEQARRMMDDPRFARTVDSFHRQWLGLDHAEAMAKDPDVYPAWDDALGGAMLEETRRFVDHVIREGDGRLDTLLTAEFSFVNPALAQLYGVDGVDGVDGAGDFVRVELPPSERAGLLTHASVLATHAHATQASPIERGVLVRERILCQTLAPPPPDVDDTPPALDPDATTRERFEQHTEDPSCAGCHALIDPIGFGFSAYDGLGGFMSTEAGAPVDESGALTGTEDADGAFEGVVELAFRLSESEQVRRCVSTQWLSYALSRPPTAAEQCSVDQVHQAFAAADYDVRELVVAIVRSDAFSHLNTEDSP